MIECLVEGTDGRITTTCTCYMLAAGYLHETSSNGSTGLEDRTGGEQLDFDRGEGFDEFGIW